MFVADGLCVVLLIGALPQEPDGHPGHLEQTAVFHGRREEHDAGPDKGRPEGARGGPQGRAQEPSAHVPVSLTSPSCVCVQIDMIVH